MPVQKIEAVLSGTLAGQFVQNVFHFSASFSSTTDPFTAAHDVADMLIEANSFVDLFVSCCPEDYQATSLRCRQTGPTQGPTWIALASTFLGNSQGQRSGNISSAQAGPLVIWIPTVAPNKTGRTFVPGVSEDDIDQMVFDGGLLAALDSWEVWCADAHNTPTAAAPTTLAIRRKLTEVYDLVSAGYTSPLVGTQRRRLHPV